MKVSDCCGVPAYSNGDSDTEDIGICPECKEHCEYIEEDGTEPNDKNIIGESVAIPLHREQGEELQQIMPYQALLIEAARNYALEEFRKYRTNDSITTQLFTGFKAGALWQAASQEKGVGVLDWLLDVNMNGINQDEHLKIIMNDGEFYWESDKDGDQPLSAERICELYNKHRSTAPDTVQGQEDEMDNWKNVIAFIQSEEGETFWTEQAEKLKSKFTLTKNS